MEYSKISSIEVHNFMAYKYAKAVYDDKGILNIKGYNHSGKTAFEMALVICLMNAFVSKQGKYIHHGEKYFRIVVNFEDGVSIIKDKYDNGQSLYEMYQDGNCIFTTKQGNKLAKITGVPTPIKQYLGLIDTETGYLNYQTRREPLWLIETQGAENYNTLNEVLKTEEISRANAMLNSDINSLNSEIVTIESELQRKELQLEACKGVTRELVDALSEKESETRLISFQDESIGKLGESIQAILSTKIPCKVESVNSDRLKLLERLLQTYRELSSIKIPESVSGVKSEIKQLKAINSIKEISSNSGLILDFDVELENVDFSSQKKLSSLYKNFKQCVEVRNELHTLEEEQESLVSEKVSFVEEAKKVGKIFVECENCGTLMEVNTNES